MNEEIKRLEDMMQQMQSFMDALVKYYKNTLTREVVFAGMIIKKSLDILDSLEYALKKYNITVQISLLRLSILLVTSSRFFAALTGELFLEL